jgi:putative transposase
VILPAWCRTSPKITEVLPLLYLHGLSSQDFAPALEGFLGSGAGLSAVTITRLTVQWQDEARAFGDRDLSSVDSGCLWADGVHLNVRLDSEKLCLLVMVGVRVDGTKELIALTEGYRESTGSWADLLRDCARRGMRAPVLAVGDGALGFWSALREVLPTTGEQRWFHKIGNVLSALPKSAQSGAKRALAESTFAILRHRTKLTKGPGSKAAGLAMAFKLIEAAQDRWRAVNAPHLVALVRAGATFVGGHLVERPAGQVAA